MKYHSNCLLIQSFYCTSYINNFELLQVTTNSNLMYLVDARGVDNILELRKEVRMEGLKSIQMSCHNNNKID